jgi:Flp pilus assembly protein CpaB
MFDCEAMQVALALVGGVLEDDTGAPEVPVQATLELTPQERAAVDLFREDIPADREVEIPI